jgi:hypothetical protein
MVLCILFFAFSDGSEALIRSVDLDKVLAPSVVPRAGSSTANR